MRTLAFPRFRATYVIAACSVGLATTCAYQAPGLMQAILVVGANAQLPLERLAAQADLQPPVSDAAVSSTAWKQHPAAQARPAAQKLDDSGQTMRARRGHSETHGYEHSVTDYKYWT
ncbi:hypothetical protein Bphy_5701 (plasmid) [Paraburkholderia phymatum STM815]|uniref:Lipoprotein n=2 Tax=Paraburkholderia phymatum TaxID=148447 RepID=B2JUZ5_PARP8|nr:hypothetical protein Bphy_5701 [Paraburkholderia phymatum STM815]